MGLLVSTLFFLAILIQIFFLLFIFPKLINQKDLTSDGPFPPISIIIAAANELENLKELLPILEKQDYPNFEIVVADDRSYDGTLDYLIHNDGNYKKVVHLRIKDLPEHFTAKKFALTMAIKKAKNEHLLFTDADCRPTSDQWLKNMVSQLSSGVDIVLGYSPYQVKPGSLNKLISYETLQTAILYLSFALKGIPFMGVGRNLMYKKSLFWQNNGFAKHHSFLSGDDDLFINEVSKKDNISIATNVDSFTESIPEGTWSEWYTQKIRHLSVGKKYKAKDRMILAAVWFSHICTYFLLIPSIYMAASWFTAPSWSEIPVDFLKQYGLAHYYPFTNWMRLVVGIFLFWFAIRWFIIAKLNKKLGNKIQTIKIPFLDFQYVLYLVVFGVITIFSNPKKIKWR